MSGKTSQQIILWGGAIGLSTIILGSCYYLYKYLQTDDDDNNDDHNKNAQEEKIEDINNGIFNDETAIKIMLRIEQLAEEIYQRDNAHIENQRKACTNHSSEEYSELCKETLIQRQYANQIASNEIFKLMKEPISFDILNEYIQKISPERLELLSTQLYIPNKNEKKPSIEVAKEAYIYYTKTFLSGLENIEAKYKLNPINENNEEARFLDLMILKIQIDDEVYSKYNTNERIAKIYLMKANMFNEDQELKSLNEQIKAIEQIS